ncbi:hypothetical protein B484DRAFT_403150 [Ochromonadaceae sp. CCMP2298]|nr:hypothetical protein B484DRAFT_403150 [Ochromonadaceae sp. CCMP2298]
MLMTADSALGEFPHLACVLVEHIAERGLGRVSLAERLCEQRNDEWTVTVEVDFEPAALRALLPEIESVGAGLGVGEGSGAEAGAGAGVPPCPSKSKSVSFGDSFSSLQFDIERRCSVLELKTAALRRLLGTYTDTVDGDGADVGTSRDVRLAGLLSRTRLRLGADRGQGVLQQEEALLHEAGLRDHIALYLEIGAPTPAAMVQEQLRVSVVLVVGNSRTAAYSAADQGARLGTVEVEAEPGESVAELKDRAGQMLLDYPPGWAMGAYGAGAGAGSGVRTREGLEVPLPDPVTPEDEAAAAISIAAVAADDSAHAQRASLRPPKPPGTRAKMEAETGAGAGVKREGGEGHEQETEAGTDAGADAEAGAEAEADRRVQCFSESLRLGNFRGRRLRRTSWMGEFAELLLEAEEGTGTGAGMGAGAGGGGEGGGVPGGAGKGGMKGAKRGGDGAVGAASALAAASAPASSAEPPAPAPAPPAAITLQQAGVRSGDTLLLEEGWLPVRGIMGIQVFLWSSAPAPTPAPVPAPVSDAAPVEAGEVSVVTGAVVVAGTVPEAQVQGQELEVELALELGALRETECARKACLLSLGSVELLERCSVLELQQRVGLLLGAQYGYMAGALGVVEGAGEGAEEGGEAGTGTEALGTPSLVPVPLDGFLLRELRADLLPGRSFWTCERDKEKEPEDKDSKDRDKRGGKKGGAGGAGAAKGTSAAVAGAKAGAGMAGVAAGGEAVVEEGPIPTALAGSSLRRLGLRGERGLVVELCLDPTRMVMGTAALPAQSPTPQSQSIPPPALFALSLPFLSQSQVRPPAGAFRLWAQELLNPGLGEGTARMSPLWPPLPVLLNGGAAPTLGHLKRAVGAVFAHIPLDHLGVYKFSPQTTEWAPLVLPATLGALAASIGGRKRVGGKRESNVTQAPYFVKEGDQFCAFDCRLIPPRVAAAAAAGAGAGANLGISLAADVQLKALKDWQKAQRRSKKNQFEGRSGGGGGGGGSGGGGGAGRVVRRPEVMLSPEVMLTFPTRTTSGCSGLAHPSQLMDWWVLARDSGYEGDTALQAPLYLCERYAAIAPQLSDSQIV